MSDTTATANPEDQQYYIGLGGRLKAARQLASLTQKELATALGMTRSTVANAEAGRQHPPLATLVNTARVLRCDPSWLLLGTTSNDLPTPAMGIPCGKVRSVRDELHVVAHRLTALLADADYTPTPAPCLPDDVIADAWAAYNAPRPADTPVDERFLAAIRQINTWLGSRSESGHA
jgi:transcriptional regulator with XRE-family HTH domain